MQGARYQTVNEAEIAPEAPFLLSFGCDLSGLRESIGRVGQVAPLVLWPVEDRLLLLCGLRRRQAMKELGIKDYQALILPRGIDGRQALHLALEDNLAARGFNDAERVLALGHLSQYHPLDEVVEYLPRLGLPARKQYLERFLSLAGLGPQGLEALADGSLDPESGEALLRLVPEDREAALSLIRHLQAGRNKRRQILTFLEEVARREGRPAAEILNLPEIRLILNDQDLSRPEKEKRAREWLRSRRYPRLVGLEKKRAELVKSLKLPQEIRLDLPGDFEGLGFGLEIEFKTPADLRKHLEFLDRLLQDPNFAALLELG